MVDRWAMIDASGYVFNVCLWDGDNTRWTPPAGITVIPAPDEVGVGWSYDGSWHAPIPVEEPVVDTPPPAEEPVPDAPV